jgi:hypothetical protein
MFIELSLPRGTTESPPLSRSLSGAEDDQGNIPDYILSAVRVRFCITAKL